MIRLMIISMLFISICAGNILNVPSHEYSSINSAIEAASTGDTILVAAGMYEEFIDFKGKAILISSNYLFSGDPGDIENTIIDGNSDSTVVQFKSGEDSSSVLNGFKIRNGFNFPGSGGGISCVDNSSPKLSNLILSDNVAANGAGLFCFNNSNPVLENVVIAENGAVNSGGGIFIDRQSSLQMHNITLYANVANQDGGGIYVKDSSSIVISSGKLYENVGDWSGGAIYATQNSSLQLANLEISDNYTTGSGGGINIISSNLHIVYGLIYGNIAFDAGAISAGNNSSVYVLNSTIIIGFFPTLNFIKIKIK